MRQDAALEDGVELVLDLRRQPGGRSGLKLGEEGRCVPLHQAVQRGLLEAVTLTVDRDATRRPASLPDRGLHAMLK